MRRKGGNEDMDLKGGWLSGLGMVKSDFNWHGVGETKEEYQGRKAWDVQPWGDEVDWETVSSVEDGSS